MVPVAQRSSTQYTLAFVQNTGGAPDVEEYGAEISPNAQDRQRDLAQPLKKNRKQAPWSFPNVTYCIGYKVECRGS